MFNSYATDIIRVIETSYDTNGVLTETESADIKARIEDANQLIRDFEGKEVMPNGLIMFKYDKEIEPFWKIKIRKKHGVDFDQKDKKWEIKKIEELGMFKRTHNEVYI